MKVRTQSDIFNDFNKYIDPLEWFDFLVASMLVIFSAVQKHPIRQ